MGGDRLDAGISDHAPCFRRVRDIRGDEQTVDLPPPRGARISGEVVGVEMRDEQVEFLDPGFVEAGVDGFRLTSRIDDETPTVTEVDHCARPLTDIADEYEPVRGRRLRPDRDDDGGSEQTAQDKDRQTPEPPTHEHPCSDHGQ